MTATQDASDAINGFPPSNHESIYKTVQNHYGSTARSNDNSSYGSTVASAFGYPVEELTANPSEANLGLSCGNPFAIANLREGETVIDLGSGAGFDVFQAARKVGASGTVIGVDMNKEMLSRANSIKHKVGAENVSFVESRITNINLPTATADCIISNCVINLVPEAEKQSAFNEMFRLLKPKGRIAISDILLKRDLPNELKSNIALYVGCIAGASHVEEYERYMRGAGFQDILIVADQSDLNIYKRTDNDEGNTQVGCCGPASQGKSSCRSSNVAVEDEQQLGNLDFNEWASSFKIYAVKPDK